MTVSVTVIRGDAGEAIGMDRSGRLFTAVAVFSPCDSCDSEEGACLKES